MTDLASLGLRVESDQVDTASTRMDKMKSSAAGLETATDRLASSTVKSDGAIAAMLASIDRTTQEMLALSRMHQQAGGAALVQAGATERLTADLQQASAATRTMGSAVEDAARTSRRAGSELNAMAEAIARVEAEDRAAYAATMALAKAQKDLAASSTGVSTGTVQLDAHMAAYRNSLNQATVSAGQKRAATQQLGAQINDFGTQVSAGINPIVAFNQQLGQLGYAMSQMGGRAGAVGAFLAGPWGAAIVVGAAVLSTLTMKVLAQRNALEEATKKLREDAKESQIAAQAKAIYAKSVDGVRDALRDMNADLSKSIQSQRQAELATLAAAEGQRQYSIRLRESLTAQLELRKTQAQAQLDRAMMPNQQGEAAALGLSAAQKAVADANSALRQNEANIAAAQQAIRSAAVPIAIRTAEELSTANGRINRTYDQMRDRAIAAARGNDQLARSLGGTLLGVERQRQAALEAERESKRDASAADRQAASAARREANIARELEAIAETVKANYDLAAAYGVSAEAALKAEAATEATGRAIRRQGDVDAFVAAQMELNASKAAASAAQAVADLRFETAARERANAAIASGAMTSTEANEAMALENRLRPLIAAAAAIEGERKEALLKIINDLTEAQKENNAVNREAQLIQQNAADQNRIASLEDQIRLVGPRTRQSVVMQSVFDTERDLTSAGIDPNTDAYREAMDNAAKLAGRQYDLTVEQFRYNDSLTITGDLLARIDDQARSVGQGLADSFGTAGEALGGLLTAMTGYRAEIESIREQEAAYALQGGNDQRRLAQFAQDRARAEVESYGTALSAAKGFFSEGSDGYRALQAAEAAYRVFQFAMSVQAMAMGAAETSTHVAQSGTKAAASTAAGAAKMFENLGPLGFPMVAAMLALLASLGLRGSGGGSSGGTSSASSVDASVSASQGYSQQAAAQQSLFASSVASKVEVKVTADRDGLNAYVAQTAREEAAPMVAQGMAAASGATRAQVFSDLDKSRTYSRG